MGFVRDNVEFTMDVFDTEVELVAVSDKASVIVISIRACFGLRLTCFVFSVDYRDYRFDYLDYRFCEYKHHRQAHLVQSLIN